MPSLSIAAGQTTKAEGNSGSTAFVFTVNLDTANAAATTVGWGVQTYSAAVAADFAGGVLPAGTLTLAAGQTSKSFTIDVAGDAVTEGDEYFYVNLSGPSANATLGYPSYAYSTIADDDTTRLSVAATDANKAEGDAGTTPYVFTVTRSGKLDVTTSVTWNAVDFAFNGTSAADFFGGVQPTGTLAFAAGETSKTVTVNVVGDATAEPNEYFSLALSNAGTAVLQVPSVAGTVLDDDTATLNVYSSGELASTNKAEGKTGSTDHVFRLTRTGGLAGVSVVDWAVTTGTAVAADFTGGALPTGKVTFAAGQALQYLTVKVAGETLPEANETFTVALSNPTNGAVLGYSSQALGTILDDDTPTLAIAANQNFTPEGNAGSTPFTFAVTRAGNTAVASTVRWDTLIPSGSAITAADFLGGVLPTGTLTFAAGQTAKTITVKVIGDNVSEANESFLVNLSSPTNAAFSGSTGAGTMVEDDDTFRYAVAADYYQANRREGDGDPQRHLFTVNRSGKTNAASTIGWSVTGGTANPAVGADFQGGALPAGILTFAAGETRKVITLNVAGDELAELDETFNLVLGAVGAGSQVLQGTAAGSIKDDDTTRLGILASPLATAPEGDSGATPLVFWVNRTGNTAGTASVAWAVTGTTAVAADFVGAVLPAGTVAFAAGQAQAALTVRVAGDTAAEANEGFTVNLSAPVNAELLAGGASATGTITDDDTTRLTLGYGNYAQAEGNSGTTAFVYNVSRSGNLAAATVVDWAVSHDTTGIFDPTENDDFVGGVLPTGKLTFAAGETAKTLTVRVAGDTVVEAGELFKVALTSATASVPAPLSAIVNDDDTPPQIGISWSTQAEGNSGSTPFQFQVYRTGSTTGASSARWTVGPAPSGVSADLADFGRASFQSGTVAFAAGETSKFVTVLVKGDTTVETSEAFAVTLSNPSGATLVPVPSAIGTIQDDDTPLPAPVLSINTSVRTNEGGLGGSVQVFTVQRSGDQTGTSSVRWTVSPHSTVPAAADDFSGGALPTGLVTFGPGEASRTLTIAIQGDLSVEGEEGFQVTLSDPVGASISTTPYQNAGNGVIQDDDAPRFLIKGGTSVAEGNTVNRPMVYTVYRTGTLDAGSVQWQMTHQAGDGSQATASDFVGNRMPAGVLNFAAGEDTKTLTVSLKGDTLDEANEAFAIELFNPVGGQLGAPYTAGGVIVDDDNTQFAFANANVSVNEGNAGSTPLVFQVRRSGDLSGTSTVRWVTTGATDNSGTGLGATANATAKANDLTGAAFPSGILTFAPGEGCKDITIGVAGDTQKEVDERLAVTLTQATGGSIQPYSYQYQAVGTLMDDDVSRVSLGYSSLPPSEGNSGSSPYVFLFTRSGNTSGVTTVTWRTQAAGYGSPATAGDFTGAALPSGVVTFAAGETTRQITVNVAGDTLDEPNELFQVEATAITGGVLTNNLAIATIANDDAVTYTLAGDDHRIEGNTGTVEYLYKLTRQGATLPAATLNWQVDNGSYGLGGTLAADFAAGVQPKGVLNLAAGQATALITVSVRGDTTVEPEEAFTLRVSEPGSSSYLVSTVSTVVDDDRTQFRSDLTGYGNYIEGNAGTSPIYLTVFREGKNTGTASVKWQLQSTPYGDQATATDFAGGILPGGTVAFAAGQTSKLITINIKGDTQVEGIEGFAVHLYDPVGGDIVTSDITGQIMDDDRGAITATNASGLNEGNAGSTPFVFTFFRSGAATAAASVAWRLTNCPQSYYGAVVEPTSADDLVGGLNRTGTIAFAAGETQKTLTIQVAGDAVAEADEGFSLLLSDAVGAELGTTQVSATIQNDDTAYLTIQSAGGSQAEGNSGNSPQVFQVNRSGKTSGAVTVDWAVTPFTGAIYGANGQADAADFAGGVLAKGKLTFAAGETQKLVTVNVKGDTLSEPNEQFQIGLSNAVGGTIRSPAPIASVIVNDDALPTTPATYGVTARAPVQVEADTLARPYVFDVTRSGNTTGAGSVAWQVTAAGYGYTSPLGYGLASPSDFAGGVFAAGTVAFAAGQTTKAITINVAGDTAVEQDERFTVALASGGQAEGTIRDDDRPILGTATANALAGTDGNDLLQGGAGADTLAGFGGDDLFYFNAPSEGGDTVLDFGQDGSDRILIQSANFGGLPLGPLGYERFAFGTPITAAQVFSYDSTTGVLSYDADGNGAGAGVAIATLKNGAGWGALAAGQILVSGALS
jgi:hypothetical protein